MLKYIFILIAGILISSCASNTPNAIDSAADSVTAQTKKTVANSNQKTATVTTDQQRKNQAENIRKEEAARLKAAKIKAEQQKAAYAEIEKGMKSLNKYIGSYPPRFANDAQHNTVYNKWLSLVAKAEVYEKANPKTERALYLLSELYRQGYNMNVVGSAEKALVNIEACLAAFETSVACNVSASSFYLSIGSSYLGKAEKSLFILKRHFSPKLNENVEAGYVYLYVKQQNTALAKKQIELFIQNFPSSSRMSEFENIKENLDDATP